MRIVTRCWPGRSGTLPAPPPRFPPWFDEDRRGEDLPWAPAFPCPPPLPARFATAACLTCWSRAARLGNRARSGGTCTPARGAGIWLPPAVPALLRVGLRLPLPAAALEDDVRAVALEDDGLALPLTEPPEDRPAKNPDKPAVKLEALAAVVEEAAPLGPDDERPVVCERREDRDRLWDARDARGPSSSLESSRWNDRPIDERLGTEDERREDRDRPRDKSSGLLSSSGSAECARPLANDEGPCLCALPPREPAGPENSTRLDSLCA